MIVLAPIVVAFLVSPAVAAPFTAVPDRFEALLNPILRQAQSDLRIRQVGCTREASPVCQFSARRVGIAVVGSGSGTGRITITASFRGAADAQATTLLEDTLSVLGATMVAYDPTNPPNRRSEVISVLGESALTVGEAHDDSAEVHYALTFDDVSGELAIVIEPLAAAHG